MRAKASGESTLLLVDAVQVLRAAQVDYAIIGAMAASVHGVIRASRDADALLSITVTALPDLERSFRGTGFITELRRGDVDDPISAVLTLHDEFENRVDLLVGIRGFDPKAFSRTIDVPLDGESLRFVSLEDFIAMKIFAGSPQDVSDATTALEVATEPLDVNLLRQLARRYGADTVRSLENVLATLSRGSDSASG
jgi:predicted nucleotidyltransferase